MRHPTMILAALALAVVAAASRAAFAAAPSGDSGIAAAVERYVKPLRDLDVFDGVVLVARGGRILALRCYGYANRELRVPNAPAQRFRIASLSKLFTSVAVGRLWEQGVLDLQTPLSRFLPAFPQADSITIEMLLRHRAGVPSINDLPIAEDAFHSNSLDDLIAHLERLPLAYPPGSRAQYSNGGYAVLAKVIEAAAGRRYEEFLRDQVLTPLGLAATDHEADGALIPHRAYGYVPSPSALHRLVPARHQQMATKTGGGSLVSTAGDLFRFAQAMERDNVIRKATWEALIPAEDGVVQMTGRCPGFNALLLRRLKDDVTVVVLSNNYASGMLAEMGRDLEGLALGRPCPPPRYRSDVVLEPAALRRWAGRYATPAEALSFLEDGVLDFRLDGDHLTAWSGREPLDALVPQSDHTFLLRNLWSEVTFDESGGRLVLRPLYRPGEFTFARVTTP